MPLPVSGTESVPSPALDEILTLALRLPANVGLKAMFTEQDAPAASDEPQPLFRLKSVVCVPPMAIEFSIMTPLPLFVSVIACVVDCVPTI